MARKPVLSRAHGRLRPRHRGDDTGNGRRGTDRFLNGGRRVAAAVAAGLALLAFVSCAKGPAAPPPATVPPRADAAAYAEGVASLKAEKYEQAADRFAAVWKENPKHPAAARDFSEAVIGLKNSGDEAFRLGKSEEAGRKWSAALRAMGHPAARGYAFPFGKAELRGSIDRLTASLMQKALVDYRAGNLEAAIADWRTVLSYDPANEEAAKSFKTATTQLENLRKMTAPK